MAFISSGYNPSKPMQDRITDIGPRDFNEFLPAVIKRTLVNGYIMRSLKLAC